MTAGETERFDRLPAGDDEATDGRATESDATTDAADTDAGSTPTRADVVAWWAERFGVPPETFEDYTFWERGAGKVWAFRGDLPSPVEVQGLGMHLLRTGGEHWKPTTDGVQRFGTAATRNVLVLDRSAASAFVRGEDQAVDWDGDWGYLIVARELAGDVAPLGVGLYIRGELRSQVPKGRRRQF